MSEEISKDQKAVKRGVTRWVVREIMGTLLYIPLLFWPAGTWKWPLAWALVILTILWVIGTAAVTIPKYPELLAERVGPRKGSKRWDTAILSTVGLLMIVKLLLAGFDRRFAWTGGLPLWLEIIGLLAVLAGYALVVWATASNAFFAQTVRIQTERGHTVASGGPYHFVRHPSYIGMIAVELGSAAMLGSGLALIIGAVSAVLFIVRTALEDRVLQKELPGYPEFAQKTRYRLIPGVW
jgi:protein-S-isoprenylcysteine O-methyltransferase Ste14